MFKNPYSPVFGGRPNMFFGRGELLERFDLALLDPSSEERALFITGTRGSGKTALLERLSQKAHDKGWLVIDLGPDHIIRTLLRSLTAHDEETRTINPQLSVSILGTGGSASGVSTAKTRRYDEADVAALLAKACANHPKGVMVSIDEIQKVSEDDVSTICNAFQLASRKGLNVILVVGGLPYAHAAIIRYAGCTYMRRAKHVELGLLSWQEAADAVASFRDINRGLTIDTADLERLTQKSCGHPYVVQLLGYYLILLANERGDGKTYDIRPQDVDEAIAMAHAAYESRALQPLVDELTPSERGYLVALAQSLDDERMGKTAEVAARLGREPSKVGYLRESLLDKGIIIAAGRGLVMFNIPYLADYVLKEGATSSNLALVRQWQL